MAPKSTSLIWNHFEKENSNIVTCKICCQKILTKNSNTKGLWTHLKSIYPIDHHNLDKLGEELKNKQSIENEASGKKVLNLNTKYESNHPKQTKFDKAMVDFF